MAGYLGAEPLAADAWFDTGDVGLFDANGGLHVRARRADLIVSGGENVYPAEVERVLEACHGIRAAAVFGVPDETWGQIVAAAFVADGTPPTDEELLAFLDHHLARHKRPRRIAFVSRLPQTGAGKLDRSGLAALASELRPLERASGGS
jgi:O-succinylbenzoic acid--CoA ligase